MRSMPGAPVPRIAIRGYVGRHNSECVPESTVIEVFDPIGQAVLRQHADDFADPMDIAFQS